MEKHNVKYLMDKGLFVTINSDDPAYVGGYVGDNYLAVQSTFNLIKDEIYRLAKNSFQASFLPETEKRKYIVELDAFMAANK